MLPGHDDLFLVNPYGLLFEEVTASSLVLVDAAGPWIRLDRAQLAPVLAAAASVEGDAPTPR